MFPALYVAYNDVERQKQNKHIKTISSQVNTYISE